jgi:hypothetical protein
MAVKSLATIIELIFILTDMHSWQKRKKKLEESRNKGVDGKDQAYPNAADGLDIPRTGLAATVLG